MSKLIQALKEKYKTPDAALRALGLDSSLLDGDTSAPVKNSGERSNGKENLTMNRKILLTRKAALAKGAIAVCLSPRLAQDKKLDLTPMLVGVTAANWGASKKKIAELLRKIPVVTFASKQAFDAGIADVVKLLDSLDGENPDAGAPNDNLGGDDSPDATLEGTTLKKGTGMDDDPDANLEGVTDPKGTGISNSGGEGMDDPTTAVAELLKGKVDDETLAHVMQLIQGGGADAEVDEFMQKLTGKGKKQEGSGGEGSDAEPTNISTGTENATANPAQVGKGAPLDLPAKPVTSAGGKTQESPKVNQQAMDAAIRKAKEETKREVTQQLRNIAEAEKIVKPIIGEVQAQDSAEAVYRLALDQAGVDLEGVHPSAFKAMVLMLPKPGEESPRKQIKIAHDSKSVVSFNARFPQASKVRQLGN